MRNVRLLLVEDELTHRRLFERNMRRYGPEYELEAVETGEAALQYLYRYAQNPDKALIVILDLKLPGINGIQVLEKMRADRLLREIQVIVLTTSDEETEMSACTQLGVSQYLNKPIDFQILMVNIERLIPA